MSDSRVVRIALWVALALASVASVLVIGLATDTSIFSLDAWTSTWNDEQRYYRTVQQMRLIGAPCGVTGYNEVPALRPSYGPYSIFVYLPYYLGSFVTGYTSHNFIYLINMVFGVVACLLIIIILRPDVRQSLLCIALFFLHFIIVRYVCSGMTEASYVLFASVFACCSIYVAQKVKQVAKPGMMTIALTVAIVAIGFWGLMRPYILAFMIIPWALLAFGDMPLTRLRRGILFAFGVLVAVVAIIVYMYLSKYYSTPYFYSPTIANDFFDRIARAIPGLAKKHVECVLYSAAKLVKLKWVGIMTFTFASCWVALLVLGVKALKTGDRTSSALLLGLVLAGLAIFEAHMLMYNYKQMHRTMLAVDVVYLITLIWYGSKGLKGSNFTSRAVLVGITCLLCVGCLALKPGDFAFPQVKADYSAEQEAALQADLAQLMPQSEDEWGNTIAHPVENRSIYIYFNVPIYMSLNSFQMTKLEEAIEEGTLKSKYLSMPDDYDINDDLRKRYKVIYEGNKHIIYLVHE